MRPFGHLALAAVALALTSCASTMPVKRMSDDPSPHVAAPASPVLSDPVSDPKSDLAAMQLALPGFTVQRSAKYASGSGISIVRDLRFDPDSSILSRADVARLEPLLGYLGANPGIEVIIEAHGDGSNSTTREADLSQNRAQAVARALLTSINVANTIVAVGAPMPQQKSDIGLAAIVFMPPPVHVD